MRSLALVRAGTDLGLAVAGVIAVAMDIDNESGVLADNEVHTVSLENLRALREALRTLAEEVMHDRFLDVLRDGEKKEQP